MSSPDNGKQFTARFGLGGGEVLSDKICRRNAITHRLTQPRSPTTTGKIERFHQTMRREWLDHAGPFASIEQAQAALDAWVSEYNSTRPHQALGGDGQVTPSQRFQPVSAEEREALPLWLPGTLTAVSNEEGRETVAHVLSGEIEHARPAGQTADREPERVDAADGDALAAGAELAAGALGGPVEFERHAARGMTLVMPRGRLCRLETLRALGCAAQDGWASVGFTSATTRRSSVFVRVTAGATR